ncbi:hypothetical protein Tco_1562998 [Tanacetum coccineum]
MVRSKSVSTKKQSQQVNVDDEGEDDLNIAYDVTQLPVPDKDIPNLGGTLGAFIQWPIGAIACFSGLPSTPATSAATKSTLPKNIQ